jgi:hypothetical protein
MMVLPSPEAARRCPQPSEEGCSRGVAQVRLKPRRTCSLTPRVDPGSGGRSRFEPTVAGFWPDVGTGHALSGLGSRRGTRLRTHLIWPQSGPDSQTLGRSRCVRFTGAFGTGPASRGFDPYIRRATAPREFAAPVTAIRRPTVSGDLGRSDSTQGSSFAAAGALVDYLDAPRG